MSSGKPQPDYAAVVGGEEKKKSDCQLSLGVRKYRHLRGAKAALGLSR